jgi:hypothetical protein
MMTADERRCLSDAFIGIEAGAPPERNTVVLYQLALTADGGHVKTRVEE